MSDHTFFQEIHKIITPNMTNIVEGQMSLDDIIAQLNITRMTDRPEYIVVLIRESKIPYKYYTQIYIPKENGDTYEP
jgi:hypothetical protein